MDYLRAVEAGTRAGLSIRQANEEAFEHAQRMEMEREAQAQRERQLGVENAANRLAQERLEAYRQGELKDAQERIGLQRQSLGMRSESASQAEEARRLGLDLRERQLADTEERNKSADQRAQDKLDLQRAMDEFRQSKQKGHYEVRNGKTYFAPDDDPTNFKEVKFPTPEKGTSKSTIFPALVNAEKAALGFGGKLALGLNPFKPLVPPPATQTNAPTGSIPMTPTTPSAPKKRVKVKGPTGQTGTIEEGDTLPDGWTEAQ